MPQDKNVTPLKREKDLQFDGERFIPGAGVEITYHHWLRYFFARQLAREKRVLDVASGEGYGAAYLAGFARSVDAFDVSAEAVLHSRANYADNPRLNFKQADVETFFAEAAPNSYDLVTAFEVIEHVEERVQVALLEGIHRVLAPDGVALVSTPDKQLYSDVKLMKNPFHVREMYRSEFTQILGQIFPHVQIYEQLSYTGSAITDEAAQHGELCEMGWTDLLRLKGRVQPGVRAGGEYLIALVSKQPLPAKVESSVLLDRSRKLVAEEVYTRQAELDQRKQTEGEARAEISHLRAFVAKLEAQLAEAKREAEIKKAWMDPDEAMRRDAMLNATIDRLLAVVTRDAVDKAEAQRNGPEVVRLRGELARFQTLLELERQHLAEMRSMVSMQLVGKAKRLWDRVPIVKNAIKAVAKKLV